VTARLDRLRRTAYLLCKDSQSADDLVQTAITRLYAQSGKARNAASVDACTYTILVRVFPTEKSSAWSRHLTLAAEYQDSHTADPLLLPPIIDATGVRTC
jgi:DNA-directed RNA polymerase specialized sigma24 family protein